MTASLQDEACSGCKQRIGGPAWRVWLTGPNCIPRQFPLCDGCAHDFQTQMARWCKSRRAQEQS